MTRSPSVALLEEQAPPRYHVAPRAKRNSWEDVAALATLFGKPLDPWQEFCVQQAMGERFDGKWAARYVLVSAPRQNGKSLLMAVRAVAGALILGEKKIVVCAHQQDTARGIFDEIVAWIEESPALAARIAPHGVMSALNRESIRFLNGARILFKARSGAGSRGFSCDCLLLDEAQILGERAWASINSTMSARVNPQAWLFGTPPTPEDDSTVFARMRASALAGGARSLAYLEWSASPDDDPAEELTRWKANPAWNTRINHEIVDGEYASYSVVQFARERLGIWDSEARAKLFPSWDALAAPTPSTPPLALGVAADVDATVLHLGAVLGGERPHLGSVLRLPWASRAAFVAEVARIQGEHGARVVLDKGGPAAVLMPELESAGVVLDVVGIDGAVQAAADLTAAVEGGAVEHGNYDDLNSAVSAASWRMVGDRRLFSRKNGDVAALEAVALAYSISRDLASYDVLDSIL